MTQQIPLEKTNQFSDFFLDYIKQNKSLEPFFKYTPNEEGLKAIVQERTLSSDQRSQLVETINAQYKDLEKHESLLQNIFALNDGNTYSVVTGHQLNIFTGPLYFIYKIVTTINLAKRINSIRPDKKIVPVYWMASEDHDFEEINHFILFGKLHTWASSQKGAVGRFCLDGLEEIIEQIKDLPNCFSEAYRSQPTLAKATRYFVNEIFGKYGLIVFDGDNKVSKSAFIPIAKSELLHHESFRLVSQTNQELSSRGYKAQAYVRPINLFYMKDDVRERIIKEGELFKVHQTAIEFSEAEIMEELDRYPERFSPNVILRPLYQELVLPNIAYVGGPSEIIYWLQLKSLFEFHKISFPVLIPRNFAMVYSKSILQKIRKIDLSPTDFFENDDVLKSKAFLQQGISNTEIQEEVQAINDVFNKLADKANLLDKTLDGFIKSEQHKAQKLLEEIEKKFKKAEERKNEALLQQLFAVKAKLFPNGSLQERSDNYLNFAINNPDFIAQMMSAFDPLNFSFYLISENE
ncbi:MAG: bacillithiol biosynthesis cysteine-adding enzyme BshC [Cytophagales bacterium]|nr:MAG: bacillithiol biosynthesis cysteine-adding enzyme BshC [Cytophagales bacterium]